MTDRPNTLPAKWIWPSAYEAATHIAIPYLIRDDDQPELFVPNQFADRWKAYQAEKQIDKLRAARRSGTAAKPHAQGKLAEAANQREPVLAAWEERIERWIKTGRAPIGRAGSDMRWGLDDLFTELELLPLYTQVILGHLPEQMFCSIVPQNPVEEDYRRNGLGVWIEDDSEAYAEMARRVPRRNNKPGEHRMLHWRALSERTRQREVRGWKLLQQVLLDGGDLNDAFPAPVA